MSALPLAPVGPMMREYDRERLMKDKGYQETFIGGRVAAFLDDMRYEGSPDTTLNAYEVALSRMALRFTDVESLEELANPQGTEALRRFLLAEWGEAATATRAARQAAVKSYWRWEHNAGRVSWNPAAPLKSVRIASEERRAYPHDAIVQLVQAQDSLRDQCALQLLALMGLRKNELRQLRVRDIDLVRNLVRVRRKGGKVQLLPLGFKGLREDLYLHLIDREPDEFLLYPKNDRRRMMDPASVHSWFKRCLARAELPATVKMHELRHTAADALHRDSKNLVLVQDMLGHESPKTTRRYLHPSREDLAAAMAALEESWG